MTVSSFWPKKHPFFGFLPRTEFSCGSFQASWVSGLLPFLNTHHLLSALTHLNMISLLAWLNFYLLMSLFQVPPVELQCSFLLFGSPEYGLKLNAFLPWFTSLPIDCSVISRLISYFCSGCHQLWVASDEQMRRMKILCKLESPVRCWGWFRDKIHSVV